MIRKILLDANILINALDDRGEFARQLVQKAKDKLNSLMADNTVSLIITPLIRYEVLRGVSGHEKNQKISSVLDDFNEIEIDRSISDLATKLYIHHSDTVKNAGGTMSENKRKFDYFHVATAKVNNLEIMSEDSDITMIEDIYKSIEKQS